MISYWIDTLVLKNWGKYLRYFTASSSPLRGNPTQCSRGSKKNFWRRCRGVCAKVNHTKYPSQSISLTLHYLPLVFLSPTSPLPFYSPSLSILPLFLYLPPFCPLAFCLLVCWIACLSRWLKITLNCVTLPIPTTMILLALWLLLLPMLNLVKLMPLCWILWRCC